jgi:outer membrane translocation and assembly module TamA
MNAKHLTALLLATLPAYGAAQTVEFQRLITQEVRCTGNETTSCDFIRSHVHVAPGDVLSEEEIANAKLRLSSLRNFESVDIHLEKGSRRDAVIVVIEVDEKSPFATEALAGISVRQEAPSSVVAGRLAHQNLFGAGKIADLSFVAITPLASDEAMREQYDVALRYADPNLFGLNRYFAVASALWRNARREDEFDNFTQFEGVELDLRVGRRIGDFSYFTFGLTFRPQATRDFTFGEWKGKDRFEVTERDELTGFNIIYGWNSEDDLYFPTQGSSFHVGAGWDFGSGSYLDRSHVQFRKTWRLADGFFAVKIGGGPSPEYRTSFEDSQLLSVNYSRTLQNGADLIRGRWYVEPGIDVEGSRDTDSNAVHYIGLKAGIRLDMTGFGIVDLYVMGSKDLSR